MTLLVTVANNIRSIRKVRKLSQEGLAVRSGFSVSYVSMMERGQRSPSLEALQAVARALEVTPWTLLQPRGDRARSHEP
jgi:transcriptional regulator with XRE-family HTH domain